MDTETDDFTDSVTSSPRSRPYSAYSIGNDSVVSEVSSIGQVKKGMIIVFLCTSFALFCTVSAFRIVQRTYEAEQVRESKVNSMHEPLIKPHIV